MYVALSWRTAFDFVMTTYSAVISSLVSFQKLEVESIALPRQMKVGVCNWRPDNHTEEDMLSNNEPSDVR